jgi:hypothetical protein
LDDTAVTLYCMHNDAMLISCKAFHNPSLPGSILKKLRLNFQRVLKFLIIHLAPSGFMVLNLRSIGSHFDLSFSCFCTLVVHTIHGTVCKENPSTRKLSLLKIKHYTVPVVQWLRVMTHLWSHQQGAMSHRLRGHDIPPLPPLPSSPHTRDPTGR